MKLLRLFYPLITVLLFMGLVFYWLFIRQKNDSDESTVYGRIEFIKHTRGSFYDIEIREHKKIRHMVYSFRDDEPDVFVGDSLFKTVNTKMLYIKSAKDGIVRAANYQDYLLGD